MHTWLRKHCPKTGTCDECGHSGRTDYALIHGHAYSRDGEDYREMCHSCHMQYDNGGKATGPSMPGVTNPNSVLDDEKVREIRCALSSGELQRDIAKRFGVSKSLISNINLGLSWSHVT